MKINKFLILFFLISCVTNNTEGTRRNTLVIKQNKEKIRVILGEKISGFYKINKYGNNIYIGFEDGKIMKIDKRLGKILWEKDMNTLVNVNFGFDDDNIYLVSINNNFYVIDQITGEIKFIYYNSDIPTILNQIAPITTNKGVIVVFNEGKIVLFDKKDWKILWSKIFLGKLSVNVEENFLIVNGEKEKDLKHLK
jgi:outer membrane protein assembly factor BamB